MVMSVIQPLRPSGQGWRDRGPVPELRTGFPAHMWDHQDGFRVISAVEVATDPGQPSKGPEYHISISKWEPPYLASRRASSADALFVLSAFGDSARFEEDNHVPNGVVRNFWAPVADSLVGLECDCKDDEPAVKLDKGDYVWRGVTR